MKEIIIQLFEKYAAYRGHGKLVALFLAALICLILMRKNHRGRVHPLLFVVSVYTGISAAFTGLIESAFSVKPKDNPEDNHKSYGILYGILSILFILFAITLSGGRIWSAEFLDSRENIQTEYKDAEAAAQYLCGLTDNPKVLANYELMTKLQCYSSHLKPLYNLDKSIEADELYEDEKKIFDAISDQHPPMEMITRLVGKEGHFFVLVDKTETWPERAAEGGYDLIDTIGNIDIYEYGGTADE